MVHTTLDWLGEWFWTTHVWMNIFPFVPFALFSFSHLLQLQVQCYAHFGHHLCSDLGSSDPSATRLCQSSAHIHVVLLPEAPCQARGKIRRSQRAMQKCMQFRNGCKELCTVFLIANVQGPVQLSHPKTHFFKEEWSAGEKASSSSFCLISFSTATLSFSQVLTCLCCYKEWSICCSHSDSMGSASAATWAAFPLSFGPPDFLLKRLSLFIPRYLSTMCFSL